VAYTFIGFFARPAVLQPTTLPPGVVWRAIDAPFVGVGVWLPGSAYSRLAPSEAAALARQFGLDAADSWVYLTYVCWAGQIDFVYGLGAHQGAPFGPVEEDGKDVEAAYTGLMEQFGVPAAVALRFEPFQRGYWGEN
jgi:hypothetical protein